MSEDAGAEIREALGDLGGLIRSVGFRIPDGALICIVGIGAST